MNHTSMCKTTHEIGADHSLCNCPCHKSTETRFKSSKKMKGEEIKSLLISMNLVLIDYGVMSVYFESHRGVPCLKILMGRYRYQVAYFARSDKYRLFNYKQDHKDFHDTVDLVNYIRSLNDIDPEELCGKIIEGGLYA